jgi:ribonuclease J
MRARIHRGAREVGGNCVELELGGKRLVLDLGLPLDAEVGADIGLPDIAGLSARDDGSLLGVVLSHPHQDHYGLVARADPAVPIYIGRAAAAILDAAAFFTPSGIRMRPAGFLEDRQPFALGPFTITPYLVDHSAFDSYALLVEGGGRRVFYSGDYRAHGRKATLVRKLCAHPPQGVDVLLLEGTHVRRNDLGVIGPDEYELELAMAKTFRSTRGLGVVFSSAQNIDRLVTVYKACKRSERTLVVDLYTATIAGATDKDTIPQPRSHRLRVYVPNRQRILVKESGEFDRVDTLRRHRIFLEELRASAAELVMIIQGSTLAELARASCLEGAAAIWSLWPGYLEHGSGRRTAKLLKEQGVPLIHLHSSGHARVEDLQELAAAMGAARVVPIHTSAPERFAELFSSAEQHPDREWWEI